MSKKLLAAAKSRDYKTVCKLLDRGADVNARDKNGITPLHWAEVTAHLDGHTEMATLLLDRGADVNARTKDGTTPLKIAASAGHTEAAALLRQRGGVE